MVRCSTLRSSRYGSRNSKPPPSCALEDVGRVAQSSIRLRTQSLLSPSPHNALGQAVPSDGDHRNHPAADAIFSMLHAYNSRRVEGISCK